MITQKGRLIECCSTALNYATRMDLKFDYYELCIRNEGVWPRVCATINYSFFVLDGRVCMWFGYFVVCTGKILTSE